MTWPAPDPNESLLFWEQEPCNWFCDMPMATGSPAIEHRHGIQTKGGKMYRVIGIEGLTDFQRQLLDEATIRHDPDQSGTMDTGEEVT